LVMAALAVHSLAMLATIAMISVAVYEWLGLALLRWAWINLDLIWIGALATCGLFLIVS